ncbi:hypothetical protein [Mycobacterium sp. C31M]
MTPKGRTRHREPWREVLADELSDETEDERRDFADPQRDGFDSEHGPVMGHDGDDCPKYAQPKQSAVPINGTSVKVKLNDGGTGTVEVIEPGQISEPVVLAPPTSNPAGEMVSAGHGFKVENHRSRPWKTAKRTHCAHCGGPMPTPKVDATKYQCEFDPMPKCKCSGCTLRRQVANGGERNVGGPAMTCSPDCGRLRNNERTRWKRAVERAEAKGLEPPPEPEDRGLKFVRASGLLSAVEGSGHRYVTGTAGLVNDAPKA